MNNKDINNQNKNDFEILRFIAKNPSISQRKLSKELGISLGKLNYCIKLLQKKGLIKIQNFKKNKNKLRYLYILTPLGISKKTKLTISFIKNKISEYDKLIKEEASVKHIKKEIHEIRNMIL